MSEVLTIDPEADQPSMATRNATLRFLRKHIVEGRYTPGTRLPTRKHLMSTLGVSPLTLQRALDRLQEEGFVRSVDRVGSFVADEPPHLFTCPLVFISAPTGSLGAWTRFWDILNQCAGEVALASGKRIPVYTGIDGHADNEDYQSLLRDLDCGRLAGLVFSQNPRLLQGQDSPLITLPGVPRVALTTRCDFMPSVAHDFESFFNRAAARLAVDGAKRVAILVTPSQRLGVAAHAEQLLASHNLSTRPEWMQVISGPESATTLLQLLMSLPAASRPDGLILGDDNFIPHAAAGLTAAGVRVPDDLRVVTHCNFPPLPEPSVMPFVRLGWDVRDMLVECLDVLDMQRNGDCDPTFRRLMPAQFEEELPTGRNRVAPDNGP